MNNSLLKQIRSAQVGHIGVSRASLALGTTIQATVVAMQTFMQTAWRATRMDKVLNALTFLAVIHNVSMLSRDVGETFLYLITSSLQALGVRDEEDQVIDVQQVLGQTVEAKLKAMLGEERYTGISEAWNKANRIVQSTSAVIWQIRSMGDATLDLLEWVGEHTGRIGNALKRWGVVGERAYPWMSERPQAFPRGRRWMNRVSETLETVENHVSVYQAGVSSVIEVQEELQETGEAVDRFVQSITDSIPSPWSDNRFIRDQYNTSNEQAQGPDVPAAQAQKGS